MVELLPEHIGEFPVAETGLFGVVETLIIAFLQLEEHVPFSALTK